MVLSLGNQLQLLYTLLSAQFQHGFTHRAYTSCVMLDIKGAFDHAHHPTLIIALYNKGCPIILIKLILNFLTNRKARFYP